MNLLFKLFSLILIVVFIGACRSDDLSELIGESNNDSSNVIDHAKNEDNLIKLIAPTPEEKAKNLIDKRDYAAALIDKRSKEEEAYSMMTAFYFAWEVVVLGKKTLHGKKVEGYWYKFEEDFTYTYGVYDEVKGSGRYHLKLDGLQLMMRDNKPSKMPEEYQLMVKEDIVVFVGKEYFSNNPKQIKTNRVSAKPSKN